ncbi:MAG: restriction endonuclease, partial [Clostridiaceae bacterium]|nr:restriction endonuclease [Clostridiaceae bacterium]
MNDKEKTLWGIHAGKTGDADSLFLKKNFVALGWSRMGDLKKIKADRESFKKAIAVNYPEDKPGSVPVSAGQLYRFCHEMKVGDYIAYPSKKDKQIHVGKIEGEYKYDPTHETGYPNLRAVKWLKTV